MDAVQNKVNSLRNEKMGYHGEFGHTLGQIQHIYIMRIIDICYTYFRLVNQTVAHNLPGFQVPKGCIQYLDSNPHKPIFYSSNYNDG